MWSQSTTTEGFMHNTPMTIASLAPIERKTLAAKIVIRIGHIGEEWPKMKLRNIGKF